MWDFYNCFRCDWWDRSVFLTLYHPWLQFLLWLTDLLEHVLEYHQRFFCIKKVGLYDVHLCSSARLQFAFDIKLASTCGLYIFMTNLSTKITTLHSQPLNNCISMYNIRVTVKHFKETVYQLLPQSLIWLAMHFFYSKIIFYDWFVSSMFLVICLKQ